MNPDHITGRWLIIIILCWGIYVLIFNNKKMKSTIEPDFNEQGKRKEQRQGSYKIAIFAVLGFIIFIGFLILMKTIGWLPEN